MRRLALFVVVLLAGCVHGSPYEVELEEGCDDWRLVITFDPTARVPMALDSLVYTDCDREKK